MVEAKPLKDRFKEALTAIRGTKKESGNIYNYLNWSSANMASKFVKDIMTNRIRKTHDEKKECKDAYRSNSLVYSSIRTFKDLIKGDGSYIDSRNESLKKYVEEKFINDSGFLDAEDVAIEEALVTGDGYIEEIKGETTIAYKPIYNSEDIYIDYDYENDEVKSYIMRVYGQDRSKEGVNQYTIITPYGRETIIGYKLPTESIIHYKFGNDVWGVYGRSAIAPTLNDIELLNKIERAVGVIAMYKAIPKKLIMPDSTDEEDRLSGPEIKQIEDLMKNSTDFESPILDRRLATLDLSDGGKDIRLGEYINYLKRKVTVAMAPEFLIHGEEVNRATSREQKQTYYLRVATVRHPFEQMSTKTIREGVNHVLANSKSKQELIGTFSYKYGEFDIELPQERHVRLMSEWNDGAITLKELRAELDLPEIEGADVFKWEVTSTPILPGENTNENAGKPTKTENKKTAGTIKKR